MTTELESPPIRLPTARTTIFDPAPELAALREEAPLCRLEFPGGEPGWLVTGHALARKLLVDQRIAIPPPPWKGKLPIAGDADAPDPFDPAVSEIGATFEAAFHGNML